MLGRARMFLDYALRRLWRADAVCVTRGPRGVLLTCGPALPLALPAIMAGIRIATVTTIGLVTVTALIGEGGLGSLILDGLIRDFKTPLVVGTLLSVALAIVADAGLSGLQRVVTPWSRGRSTA